MKETKFKVRVTIPGGATIILHLYHFGPSAAIAEAEEKIYDALSNLGFSLPDEYRVEAEVIG